MDYIEKNKDELEKAIYFRLGATGIGWHGTGQDSRPPDVPLVT